MARLNGCIGGAATGWTRRLLAMALLVVAVGVTLVALQFWLRDRYPDGSREEVVVDGAAGGIVATLYVPKDARLRPVVLVHGNRRAGRNHRLLADLARMLARKRVVLSIDLPGYGDSPGPTAVASLDFSAAIVAAARYVHSRFGIAPEEVALVGHSLGAAEVLLGAGALHSRRVVAVGLGNWQHVFEQRSARDQYARKLMETSRLSIDPERLPSAAAVLAPEPLFAGLAADARVILVYGSEERHARERLRVALDGLDDDVRSRVEIASIEDADHMFRTEGTLQAVWTWLRPSASTRRLATVVDAWLE